MNSTLSYTVQFDVVSPKSNAAAVHGVQECVVLPTEDRKKLLDRPSTKAGLAKTELQFLLDELKPDASAHTQSIELHREGGGTLRALLLSATVSTFDLHEGIRKLYSPVTPKNRSVDVVLDVAALKAADQKRAIEAFASFVVLQAWSPEKYGRKAKSSDKKKALQVKISSRLEEDEVLKFCEKGRRLAIATNRVRTLAELPGNHLTPHIYRKRIEEMAVQWKVRYEFLDVKELRKRKAGAFLAVVQADSETESGIAKLTYKGPGKNLKKLTLVGKGVCFDTGGYNVKPGDYMQGMHRDMTGSALALSILDFLVESRAALEVNCYLAIAENLISPTGYRPNDVVVASDGTSIEVLDTDAEGRMVLADALSIATRETKPDLMLDFATLTGTCVRALGTKWSGIFSHSESLAVLGVECGKTSGERVWSFPVGADYAEGLKSDIADIAQLAKGNLADHIYAATFLSHFAGKGTPWIHVDLASESHKGGLGLVNSETTGFGVRWAVELVEKYLS